MCTFLCMHTRMYVCTYVRMHVCVYVCIYVCMYEITYVRIYVCMCVSMYLCMYARTCIRTCAYVCRHVYVLLLLSCCHCHYCFYQELCRQVYAFMLVVQPRKVIFHPNALVHGWQSVEALIAAAEVVQAEAGLPVPGTYRHHFMNDTEPRDVPISRRGDWSMGRFTATFGTTVTDDDAALQALQWLEPGELHDMTRLPPPVWQGFARTVAAGGLRAFLQRHPAVFEYVPPHHFRVLGRVPPAPGPQPPAAAAAAAAPAPPPAKAAAAAPTPAAAPAPAPAAAAAAAPLVPGPQPPPPAAKAAAPAKAPPPAGPAKVPPPGLAPKLAAQAALAAKAATQAMAAGAALAAPAKAVAQEPEARPAFCEACGWQELHMRTCQWCRRPMCDKHGKHIPGRWRGDMPSWQCNPSTRQCWEIWELWKTVRH